MVVDKAKIDERDSMERIIQCKLCNKRYEDPIILPCFKTICSKHVYIETNGLKFKCNFCKNDHNISNFPTNDEMLSISDHYIHVESIYLGENNEKAKLKCQFGIYL